MLRLVMDTDVIVTALRSFKGASAQLLAAAELGHVQLLIGVALMLEYEEVCNRPEHVKAAHANSHDITNFLRSIAAIAEPVVTRFTWRPQLHDADDEMVLETAINGGADAIVTFNVKHYLPAANRFGIEILNPGEVLRRLRK